MNVLVIGYGSAGRRHAENARELGHRVYVQDKRAPARRAAEADGFVAGVAAAPLPTSIRAAIIATPASTHYPVACELLECGYAGPLFVEKPLDITSSRGDFWLTWPHPTTMVGYNWRFADPVRRARDSLGLVSSLAISTFTNMKEWPGAGYASPLLECSHDLDLVRFFTSTRVPWPDDEDWELIAATRREQAEGGEVYTLSFDNAWAYLDTGSEDAVRAFSGVSPVKSYGANLPVASYALDLRSEEGKAMLDVSYQDELAAFLDAAYRQVPVGRNAAWFGDGLAAVRIAEAAEEILAAKE